MERALHAGDFQEYSVGQHMVHPSRGKGTIAAIDTEVEKFCTVLFENGERHSYSKTSMEKFKDDADQACRQNAVGG